MTTEGYSANFTQCLKKNEDTVKKFNKVDFNDGNLTNTLKEINQVILNGNEGLEQAIYQQQIIQEKDKIISIDKKVIQKQDSLINNLKNLNSLSIEEIKIHKERIDKLSKDLDKSNKKLIRRNTEIKILGIISFIEGIVIFLKLK